MLLRLFVIACIAVTVAAPSALAQGNPAGVVTTLEGSVTASRTAAPQPVTLKFKDPVYFQDRIATGERSLARVLIGGKAVVTVRERSALTITEVPGRSTIALESGKFALAVAPEKMKAGDRIEIRTPNAVAGVRGTVVIAETRGSAAAPSTLQTDFFLIQGFLEGVTAIDPATRAPVGPARTLNVMEQFRVTGIAPGTVSPIRPDQLGAIRAGLQPSAGKPPALPDNAQAVNTAAVLAGALTGTGDVLGVLATRVFATQAGSPTPEKIDATPTILASGFSPGPQGSPITDVIKDLTPPTKGANLITNGGFESGFAGWTLFDQSGGSGTFFTQTGTLSPQSSFSVPAPPQGSVAAMTDQGGPGAHFLFRDITVPAGTPTLQFRLFIGNRAGAFSTPASLSFNTFPNQQARVDIMNPSAAIDDVGSGVLRNLFRTQVGDPLVTAGYETFSFGLSEFQGQTVRLRFAEVDNQLFFQFGIDDVILMDDAPLTLTGGARFTTADPLLVVSDAPVATPGAVYGIYDGSVLTSVTTAPFARLTNAPVTSPRFLEASGLGGAGGTGFATFKLRGPLLVFTTDNDSALTLPRGLVGVFEGGQVTVSGSAATLVSIAGGAHEIATTPGTAMIDLRGRANATASEVVEGAPLTLGTDEPLRHGGALLDVAGAEIEGNQIFRIDTALLEASLPALISLRKGSVVTTAGAAIELSELARVTSLGPLVQIDGSLLTVASGAAVNVANGSVLDVKGDLLRLVNGGRLALLNGPVLIVSGGSITTVGGALIAFGGGGGNAVTVTNSLCSPCRLLGGIPVALRGGAVASNVSIANAVTGLGLGSITLSNPTLAAGGTALVVVNGAGSKVSVGPR